ncbi:MULTISPECIES: hypothetical protein [Tritonibacter]|uniref:EF-hand domain-containing protein n=1 Tax=Tritonibacter scottomollicae TaxID=483013 RepID=A0A2T1A8W2_TRISK|nr:hypothetical protein [Tritonibacter scottomollicae]PRZ45043.1 hypothetical protein CLV89_11848 [Tritonibacter scottomollicae]WOI34462.1 hypothetical protein R1T40_06960 [Tritonibacter scottomollicae]
MKSIVLTTAAVAALFAAPAVAEVEQAGALTYKELKQEYPTLTKKTFEMVDVNKDGVADMEEIDQAEQSDVLEAQSMMDKS